jgi:hypothetical protein
MYKNRSMKTVEGSSKKAAGGRGLGRMMEEVNPTKIFETLM